MNDEDTCAPSAETSLSELMAMVAESRDRQAFIRLFDHFAPRIKAYLRRLQADETTAEDLVQEVMLTVWRRAEQFDPNQASLATWIFTIARNRRIDVLRKERRPEIDPNDPALVPDPDQAADQLAEAQQEGGLLRTAIQGLPEEQSRLLHLSYFEDKSHSFIAQELGLPLGTVKSRIRLAMSKLREELTDLR
jgi:RNA polymerase sigma factor (sigma-70 family)